MNVSYRIALGRNEAKALCHEFEQVAIVHGGDTVEQYFGDLPNIMNLYKYLTDITHSEEKKESTRGNSAD